MITIVGSARGSAGYKNCKLRKTHIMCIIISSNKKFYPSKQYNDTTLHRQDIWQTTRPHRRHMAGAHQTLITKNGIIFQPSTSIKCKQQHYHRSIKQSSTTRADEAIRAHITHHWCSLPSPQDLHSYAQCPTDHAPTSTKVMGNHRTTCILKR